MTSPNNRAILRAWGEARANGKPGSPLEATQKASHCKPYQVTEMPQFNSEQEYRESVVSKLKFNIDTWAIPGIYNLSNREFDVWVGFFSNPAHTSRTASVRPGSGFVTYDSETQVSCFVPFPTN